MWGKGSFSDKAAHVAEVDQPLPIFTPGAILYLLHSDLYSFDDFFFIAVSLLSVLLQNGLPGFYLKDFASPS